MHVLLGLLLGVVTFGVTLTLVVLGVGLGIIAVVVAPVVLRVRPRVLHASADELLRHEQRLDALDKSSADGQSVWRRQG